MPGGVGSPVRAFGAVGGAPLFIQRAKGSHVWDSEGRGYIDYVGSWGPMILGHAFGPVVRAAKGALKKGSSFGAPTELEVALASEVRAAFPSVERLRFVGTGTEAAMSALRVARAATGRKKVIKFDGAYHGHADPFLVRAGSGAATLGVPDSAGVPDEIAGLTLVARFNDIGGVEALLERNPGEIAAVIVEPIMANIGVVLPRRDFLNRLRELTTKAGALLIFDEVITGFRVALGGVQEMYGVRADLTCLGKILGGGLPAAAYGGRRDLMALVAPEGPVYQAGTLSGNPVAMAAGLATVKILKETNPYGRLSKTTQRLTEGLKEAAEKKGIPVTVERAGSIFTLFFTQGPVVDADGARKSDTKRFARFFHAILEEGIYWPPSQFEAAFVSTEHGEREIERTLRAAEAAFEKSFHNPDESETPDFRARQGR